MPDLTDAVLREMLSELLDIKDEITLMLAGKGSLSHADIARIRKALDPMRGRFRRWYLRRFRPDRWLELVRADTEWKEKALKEEAPAPVPAPTPTLQPLDFAQLENVLALFTKMRCPHCEEPIKVMTRTSN